MPLVKTDLNESCASYLIPSCGLDLLPARGRQLKSQYAKQKTHLLGWAFPAFAVPT